MRSALLATASWLALWAPGAPAESTVEFRPELARALDDELAAALRAERFTSAVVSIVDSTGLAFHRAYGASDFPDLPADPARTQYLIGSITKTFTAAVTLQLLDEGRIHSLSDPANRYLKRVQLPDWQGRAVSIADLLTHRGGFDEHLFEMAPTRRYETPTPAKDLRRLIPGLVREPGSLVAYSNDGFGVLGVLIEDLENETLQAVMRRRLFAPLGMSRTDLPYHEERLPDVARAYYHHAGQRTLMPFIGNTPFMAPAGSIVSTADDMARYMLAQLNIGDVAGALSQSVRDGLHTPVAGNDAAMAQMSYSMMIDKWNGHTVLEHGGLRVGYSTHMLLLPQAQLGMFIAIAGAADPKSGVPGFRANLVRNRVLSELFGPYQLPDTTAAPGSYTTGLQTFTGDYIPERRPLRGKKGVLSPAYVQEVRVGEHGDLTIAGRPQRRIGETLFVTMPGPGEAASYTSFALRGPHMMMLGNVSGAQRIEGLHPRTAVIGGLTGLTVLATALLAFLWPARGVRSLSAARWAALTAAAASVGVALLIIPGYPVEAELNIMAGGSKVLAAGWLGLLVVIASLALLVLTLIALGERAGGSDWRARTTRGHLVVLSIAGIAMSGCLAYFHLIGGGY